MEILLNPVRFYRQLLSRNFWPWGTVMLAGLTQGLAAALMSRYLIGSSPLGAFQYGAAVFAGLLGAFLTWGLIGALLGLGAGFGSRPFQVFGYSFRIGLFWGLIALPLAAFLAPQISLPPIDVNDPHVLETYPQTIRKAQSELRSSVGMQLFRYGGLVAMLVQLGVSYVGLHEAGASFRRALIACLLCAVVYSSIVIFSGF